MDIQIRPLRTPAEYAACVELQKEIWGPGFTETVPAAILHVAQKIGGIATGAFHDGMLIGFVFGISGIEADRAVHWSDMLAVRHSYRDQKIGERLKMHQRSELLSRGITRMYWTFDPFDAKNAYVNFCKLGVSAREYVPDMYGQTDSPLHAHGTDRLIAIWEMDRPRRSASVDARIEIPADFRALPDSDAMEWRTKIRAAFQRLLPEYVVTGFVRETKTAYYALTSASNFAA